MDTVIQSLRPCGQRPELHRALALEGGRRPFMVVPVDVGVQRRFQLRHAREALLEARKKTDSKREQKVIQAALLLNTGPKKKKD